MDILNIIDNTLGRFLYLGTNIAMTALPIYAIFKAIQYIKNQKKSKVEAEDIEVNFYETATEIESRLQWEKEKSMIRKSNEILLHLIQDEHREEDR